VEELVIQKELSEKLDKVIKNLEEMAGKCEKEGSSWKARKYRRFAFVLAELKKGKTLEETGQLFDPPLTRERIRQIKEEVSAFLKKHFPELGDLL